MAKKKATKKKIESPFFLLKEIERRSLEFDIGLPVEEEIKEEWGGISFRIDNQKFVAEMGEVLEVLSYPEMSKVPRSKPWMIGIANVRGNLLPIMDLKNYLIGEKTNVHRRSRVLVVNSKGIVTGLLVDESMGIKRFFVDQFSSSVSDVNTEFKQYVIGSFDDSGDEWYKFSVKALSDNPQFIRAAV